MLFRSLVAGLVVTDKKVRVAQFQKATVHSVVELLGAAGLENPNQIRRSMVNRRTSVSDVKRYDELYPYLKTGCLLNETTVPKNWQVFMNEANAASFEKSYEELTA